MSFLSNLFRGAVAKSILFIDISADSVAGAYTHYTNNELPALLYSRRFPIEIRKGEPHAQAMLRALEVLGTTLIREGAPVLLRASGHGHAETILVSIDAPWQQTTVRTEHFARKSAFIFTKAMVTTALEKTSAAPEGKYLADESIIGTILNGYETRSPYGKKVQRAEVVILTSFVEEEIAKGIAMLLKKLYHTEHVFLMAGSSLRYQTILQVFPHEHDALIFDAAGSLTSIGLVRKGLLVAVVEVPSKYTADSWVEEIGSQLSKLSTEYPLPRTIFLLARESEIVLLQKKLDAAKLAKLWLSDNPPKVVAVLTNHVAGSVRQVSAAPPDLQLLLMAIFGQHHIPEKRIATHNGSILAE